MVDFFHIAHTHPSGGVDVPFGVYDLLLLKWSTTELSAIINFIMPDIWQTVRGRPLL